MIPFTFEKSLHFEINIIKNEVDPESICGDSSIAPCQFAFDHITYNHMTYNLQI